MGWAAWRRLLLRHQVTRQAGTQHGQGNEGEGHSRLFKFRAARILGDVFGVATANRAS